MKDIKTIEEIGASRPARSRRGNGPPSQITLLSHAKPPRWKRIWDCCDQCFREQNSILWPHLSRTINLLVIVNISLFFLTGGVTRSAYYFPLISLCLLALANLLILLPLGLQARLPFYFFGLEPVSRGRVVPGREHCLLAQTWRRMSMRTMTFPASNLRGT